MPNKKSKPSIQCVVLKDNSPYFQHPIEDGKVNEKKQISSIPK